MFWDTRVIRLTVFRLYIPSSRCFNKVTQYLNQIIIYCRPAKRRSSGTKHTTLNSASSTQENRTDTGTNCPAMSPVGCSPGSHVRLQVSRPVIIIFPPPWSRYVWENSSMSHCTWRRSLQQVQLLWQYMCFYLLFNIWSDERFFLPQMSFSFERSVCARTHTCFACGAACLPRLDRTVFPKRKCVLWWSRNRCGLMPHAKDSRWMGIQSNLSMVKELERHTNQKPQRHRRHHPPAIYLSYMFRQQETHVLCRNPAVFTATLTLVMYRHVFSCWGWCIHSLWPHKALNEMVHTKVQCQRKCWFLLYLRSYNVCIGAGAEPLKERLLKSPFCFPFYSRCQRNPYLSHFETAYVSCQPFLCTETPAKSKSSRYRSKCIMWSQKTTARLERGLFLDQNSS